MSDKIYLVTGWCGEYSDRREWIVCWYPTQAEAERHVALCREQYASLPEDVRYDTLEHEKHLTADPFFSTDYTGTEYAWVAVERGKEGGR